MEEMQRIISCSAYSEQKHPWYDRVSDRLYKYQDLEYFCKSQEDWINRMKSRMMNIAEKVLMQIDQHHQAFQQIQDHYLYYRV